MENENQILKNWHDKLSSFSGVRNQNNKIGFITARELWLSNNECPLKDEIKEYYVSGEGIKSLCKKYDITYTVMRKILKMCDIDIRKGRNVITDKLREKRSNNVKGDKNPWYNWPENMPALFNNSKKSISGWYDKSNGDRVYLRSTLEYIFAKWLDNNKVIWKYEVKSYKLLSGKTYRPDFFIYDENSKLKTIVEIKGVYLYSSVDRLEKTKELIKEISDVYVSIITDLTPFIKDGSNYQKELKIWKKIQGK